MEMYWSAVAKLRNNPDATVEDTIPTRLLVKRTNTEVILPSMPPAVKAHGTDNQPNGVHHPRHSAGGYQFVYLRTACLQLGAAEEHAHASFEKCSKSGLPLPCYLAQQVRLEDKCKDGSQCGGDEQSYD